MKAESPRAVFVYGTLRRGAPMHRLLETGTRFIGPARYRGRLLDLGAFPGVVPAISERDVVVGALFELVSDDEGALLDCLDR